MLSHTRPLFFPSNPTPNTLASDWSFSCVRFGYLQLAILPLEGSSVSRNQQRRLSSYRGRCHMRRLPLCLGYWQWTRKPGRKLSSIRIYCSLCIPNLHRLPVLHVGRSQQRAVSNARIPSPPAHHHGILHHPYAYSFIASVHHSLGLQYRERCLQRYQSLRADLAHLSPIRALCFYPNRPRCSRSRCPCPFSRSISRRL